MPPPWRWRMSRWRGSMFRSKVSRRWWRAFRERLWSWMASLLISSIALFFAVPFGVGAAVYVNQIAGSTERNFIKPYIEFISAIPSVVIGFFGVVVFGEAIRLLSQMELRFFFKEIIIWKDSTKSRNKKWFWIPPYTLPYHWLFCLPGHQNQHGKRKRWAFSEGKKFHSLAKNHEKASTWLRNGYH